MVIDNEQFLRAYLKRHLLRREYARANGEVYPVSKRLEVDAQVLDFGRAHYDRLFRARQAARAAADHGDSDRT